MHEITICKNIIRDLQEYNQIESVTFEVGSLAHLTPEELIDTMNKLVNYNINITKKDAIIKCSCGYKGIPKIVTRSHDLTIFECPKCGELPEILEGDQIIIKEVRCA
ncbi:MAG: hydrogenase maturation nickel metallochaperone HypA [Nanoarchaeota archaeon]|nr:hydrogenase maturation nickel metallochaperone HypA [Nanoarchaeota archaeon]